MAYVNSATAYDSGPIAITGVTAGNCLVAWVSGNSTLASTSLPAGWLKQTHVYNAAGGATGGCFWVYPNHPGGSVSDAITGAPSDPGWSIHEYSGRDTSAGVVEDETTNTGTGTTFTHGSITSTDGADIVVAGAQESTPFTATMSSPYTRRTLQDSHVHETGDDENVTAGSTNPSPAGTISSGSDSWVSAAVSLAEAGGGPTSLVVADATSASTIDNVVLTQAHTIVVADVTSGSTIDNVTLGGPAVTVTGQDPNVGRFSRGRQQHHRRIRTLEPSTLGPEQYTASSQTANLIALDYFWGPAAAAPTSLVVAEATSGSTIDALVLTQAHSIVVADSTSGSTVDSLALTQDQTLVVADTASGSSIDGVTLDVASALVVADSTSGSTIDGLTITQAHTLTVPDATSGSAVDSLTLTQAHTLIVADSRSGSTVDGVALTQAHLIAVAEAVSGSTIANVTLGSAGSLVVADVTCASTIDGVTITQAHTLTVIDATGASTIDNVTIVQVHALTVADLTSSSTIDGVTLTQAHVLAVADAIAGSSIDTIEFAALIVVTGTFTTRDLTAHRTTTSIDPHRVTSTTDLDRTTKEVLV